jgi:tRNA threonylcarbamoyl adenosine modification protein YeaZ
MRIPASSPTPSTLGLDIGVRSSPRTLDGVIVLALDTATPAVTAGVVRLAEAERDATPETLATRVTVDARAHGELLTPHVRAALADAGLGMDRVDAIVCGTGPGPFTGLRVGMVTAAALGHALGRPVYGVCTLDAIAHDARVAEPLLVATDARRREVYWATYDAHGTRLTGPDVTAPAAVTTTAACAAGEGARKYADVLGLRVVAPDHPSPAGLVAVVADQVLARATPAEFRPLYLRRPDAMAPGPGKKVLT